MKVIVPIAGSGARMRPHTWSRPKPLVEVGGKPMLGHVLDQLATLDNVDELIFIVGWLGDQIRPYVEANYPQYKIDVVVQEELLGQSQAIWLARKRVNGPCFILFGDTISQINLRAMANADADGVLGVWEVENPRPFGIAFTRLDGTVERLVEKPNTTDHKQAAMGVYYLREGRDLIKAIEEQMARKIVFKGEYFLADAFNVMIENGARFTTEPMRVWKDCGTPELLLEANRWLLENGFDNSQSTRARMEGSTINPPARVADDAVIMSSVIGPFAVVDSGCKVIGSQLSNLILMKNGEVHNSCLHASIVGERTVVKNFTGQLSLGDDGQVG
jgi:glucose-1-phosphate thymidylyltransferase